ncbi:small G protein signaling modulator 1 [Chanos chanos]|uniref:Small G protein signaling modulator 1 n=1 Tax=Chanos chanos TaxID=29144 RepID=A0A6J2WTM5_CHACN|nr:small G protein signaling modulator 1-like [Chanos chanos]
MATAMAEAETRQRLVRNVKKEVKQIMEEAVTRKFVHEDSSHIVSFCAAVEACVLHGLKRRAAGFLRSNKIAALFTKVGKNFPPAEELCRKAQELEQIIESRRSQTLPYNESSRKLPKMPSLSPQAAKHLWIRTALIEKVLDKIVLYLVENSSNFYEKEAVLMDPVDGPILASLLVGPCALEYTKMKTADHFWTDPSADELVQRHRIHSGHCRQDSPTKRPALCIQKRHSSSSMDERPSPSPSARDYVESLHQNSRATLLFGKNNVLVQPKDDMEAIPGYLSLHQTADVMTLKWTPNQLMNGSVADLEYERSVYWDYAMTIRLEEIVYLHCHQQVDSGGTVVLVSQDGIQRPPLRFPRGGHLLQFLSCLENGLLPHGQLDPPLWSQRGKGKVFPKLRKRGPSCDSISDKEEDEATDYVFRILFPNSQSEFVAPELIDQGANMWHPSARKSSCSSCSQSSFSEGGPANGCNHERAPLKLLCDNMKYQIVSRAFYGWLAYCRHLSTVRTHLSALVNHTIVDPYAPCDAYGGLTSEVWNTFLRDCGAYKEQELLRLVYFGGVEPSLRKEVWPFLLGHYQFGMTEDARKEVDEQVRACYEQTMSEWLGCEAIVRQREKEQHAAALAKCSSGVSMDSTIQRMMHRDSTISNESSQSGSSGRQSHARLRSDSSSSTQVFESVEEVDQIETEPKVDEVKQVPKIPNGAVQNGTSSPDSGHPSSRNFSVTSGFSDHSLSTEDGTAQEPSLKTSAQAQQPPAHPPSPNKASQPEEGELPGRKSEGEEKTSKIDVSENVEKMKEVDNLQMEKNDGDEVSEMETCLVTEMDERSDGKTEIEQSKDVAEVGASETDKDTPGESKETPDSCDALKVVSEMSSVQEKAENFEKSEAVGTSKAEETEKVTEDVTSTKEATVETKGDELSKTEATSESGDEKPTKSESDDMPHTETAKTNEDETMMDGNSATLKREESAEKEKDDTARSEGVEGTLEETADVISSETVAPPFEQDESQKMKELKASAEDKITKTEDLEGTKLKTGEAALITEDNVDAEEIKASEVKNVEEEGKEITLRPTTVDQDESLKTQSVLETAEVSLIELESPKTTSREAEASDSEVSVVVERSLQREPQHAPVAEEILVPAVQEVFSTREMGAGTAAVTTESDESPSAIEMEDIPMAKVSIAWDRKVPSDGAGIRGEPVPMLDLRSEEEGGKLSPEGTESILSEEPEMESFYPQFDSLAVGSEMKNDATSPVSSIGTTYSQELLDMYTINLHRIEKDVQRCDRNYWYFTPANLEKLRNIMCSYIWQHLEIGYVQGMCDLLAPLLVILDDEAMAFSCFTELMKRMNQNFPHGGAMDTHFANMRSLIQILDSELFELMHQNGDYTHFYFCYRWFLLDFKRELVYDDVFSVWETIWAAKYVSSSHFVLFIALALVEIYRDIILENNMDFTDIIKFFNEMAEHHNIKQILTLARDLVCKVQTLIENK